MVNKQSSSQVRYMKKFAKGLVRFLITMVIVTVFIIGIQIVRQGMWLWGLPDLDEIQSVSIAYPAVTNQVKEVSSKEDVELALKLTGFLNYSILETADTSSKPLISITYHCKDGSDQTISANEETVWWNGKAYAIKQQQMFINLAEGVFFNQ